MDEKTELWLENQKNRLVRILRETIDLLDKANISFNTTDFFTRIEIAKHRIIAVYEGLVVMDSVWLLEYLIKQGCKNESE